MGGSLAGEPDHGPVLERVYHKRTMVRLVPHPISDSEAAAAYDPCVSEAFELPQVERPRAERTDAARNRAAILQAAQRLLERLGADAITMDQLACEAGVGKGTLFRRFGDRASLFHALLDESERRLQEGFIRGPAPLGPGAPPSERLVAFGHALLELTVERAELLLAARPPEPSLYYGSAVYTAYRVHVRGLLEQCGVQEADYLADVLLATLAVDLVVQQLDRGLSLEDCKRGWERLVSGCCLSD
jgi:AcrR family transcriptional regulator